MTCPNPAERWYRQTTLWLCAAVFALFLGGSIWLIGFAKAHDDPPLDVDGPRIMTVPVTGLPGPAGE